MLKVDGDLLLEAQRQIGADTPDAAVNEALQRLVDQERAKRLAALAEARQMAASGELDFAALEEVDE